MIGTILHDRWRILAELGRGGMGEVYLAEHLALGRKEALKILKAQLASDVQFVSRFRREARAVNRLQHPNIVALYDFGRLDDGRFYLAMEYAEGIPVSQLLQRELRLPPARAVHLLAQLAYAVHHAHSRDVVHRDLKPGNLIVGGADDHLKVLDFGMAKIVAPDLAESAQLSATDVVWGTPRYLSPERAMGIGDDPRSDLYAIGCIGYELIVGAPVFTGTSTEIVHAHVTQFPKKPSVAAPGAGIPPELDAAILRCLEKEPAGRYSSAAELYAALRRVPGYPPVRIEPRRRHVAMPRGTDEPPTQRTPVEPPPPAEPRAELRGALRQVAETLLDLGEDDTRLVTGVAYLRDHELSLARHEAAQDALELEVKSLRETLGDRERALRFARGELELSGREAPELEAAIHEIEARLASAHAEGDRLAALEQGLAHISALRMTCLDRVKSAYTSLEQLVDEVLPAHAGHPRLAPLAERLALVRRRRYPDREG